MLAGFTELYTALAKQPWAATAALFATAWIYERYRNAKLSRALIDLSGAQIKGVAALELAFVSFKDTIISAVIRK
jgi:hypothetical protein